MNSVKETRTNTSSWITRWLPPSSDPQAVREFARRVAEEVDEVVSILFAPFPYGRDELLMVISDEAQFVPDIHGRITELEPPEHLRSTCLRVRELFELGIGGFVMATSEATYPVAAFWLARESVLLHGRDMREEIPVRRWTKSEARLAATLAVQWARRRIVGPLRWERPQESAITAAKELRYLMLVALLTVSPRCVAPAELAHEFATSFPGPAGYLEPLGVAVSKGTLSIDDGYRISFLFDRFTRALRRVLT